MLLEYPLGSGGDAFLKTRGPTYLAPLGVHEARSLHNGYLEEATSWGIQGIGLRLGFCAVLFALLRRRMVISRTSENLRIRADACAMIASLIILMTVSFFGHQLRLEWIYWLVGYALALGGTSDPVVGDARVDG